MDMMKVKGILVTMIGIGREWSQSDAAEIGTKY